jgi:hypothetical protein
MSRNVFDQAARCSIRLDPLGFLRWLVCFEAAMRTLREEDAAATLEEIAAGTASRCLLCWISLM